MVNVWPRKAILSRPNIDQSLLAKHWPPFTWHHAVQVLVGMADGQLQLWNIRSGKRVHVMQHVGGARGTELCGCVMVVVVVCVCVCVCVWCGGGGAGLSVITYALIT